MPSLAIEYGANLRIIGIFMTFLMKDDIPLIKTAIPFCGLDIERKFKPGNDKKRISLEMTQNIVVILSVIPVVIFKLTTPGTI